MKRHRHHKQPKSRGGSNDPSNLEELDPYSHALHHAWDFLYNEGPRFDFRHEAWPLLPDGLKQKVLEKAAEHSSKVNKGRKKKLSEEETQRRRERQKLLTEKNKGKKRSEESKRKMREARLRYLEEHGPYEVHHSEETRRKQSEAAQRRVQNETPEERQARLDALARGRETFVKNLRKEQ
jgi:hypothetical protein